MLINVLFKILELGCGPSLLFSPKSVNESIALVTGTVCVRYYLKHCSLHIIHMSDNVYNFLTVRQLLSLPQPCVL